MNDSNKEWNVLDIIEMDKQLLPVQIETYNNKPLPQKQYDFVVNYIKNGFNGKEAAIKAGYSRYSAYSQSVSLLAKPEIKDKLEKAYEQVEKKVIHTLGITFVWKLKRLKHIVEQYIPIDGTELKQSDVRVGLQALSEINKMTGDYAPDKRLNVTYDATSTKMKEVRKVYDEF